MELISITEVMFSLPDIILVSFIIILFYYSLTEFLLNYLVRDMSFH